MVQWEIFRLATGREGSDDSRALSVNPLSQYWCSERNTVCLNSLLPLHIMLPVLLCCVCACGRCNPAMEQWALAQACMDGHSR